MKLLTGHISPETAYVVEDYPYGFRLRCKIRYWIEYKAKKGFRCVSQTTNPKRPGEVWNKPKASTYSLFGGAMYLDENEHVQFTGLSEYSDGAEVTAWTEKFGAGVPEEGRLIHLKWVAAKVAYAANRESGDPLAKGLPEARKAFVETKVPVTRDEKLNAVWKHTHNDYKGKLNGERSIMIYRQGTCLVLLKDLTDAEIEYALPSSMKQEIAK